MENFKFKSLGLVFLVSMVVAVFMISTSCSHSDMRAAGSKIKTEPSSSNQEPSDPQDPFVGLEPCTIDQDTYVEGPFLPGQAPVYDGYSFNLNDPGVSITKQYCLLKEERDINPGNSYRSKTCDKEVVKLVLKEGDTIKKTMVLTKDRDYQRNPSATSPLHSTITINSSVNTSGYNRIEFSCKTPQYIITTTNQTINNLDPATVIGIQIKTGESQDRATRHLSKEDGTLKIEIMGSDLDNDAKITLEKLQSQN